MFCGHCGNIYRRIRWNNRGCKSTVWRCVSRVLKKRSGINCPARTIHEETLQSAVVTAVNDAWYCRDKILPKLKENLRSVIENDTEASLREIDVVARKKQSELLEAGNDQKKIELIGEEIVALRDKRQAILTEAAKQKNMDDRIEDLAHFFNEQTGMITEYSDRLVRRLIEKVIIYDEMIVVEFKSGLKMEVEA
ncbi:zinc ribbon domain-containing protein [Selenomonas ruminantium]|uniref:zinc ribbon domain-containing protein n=1 Tax=Selenomonas ruminantium TaxID=971 RepID=UPI00210B916F|nr:zinc ribbon domain-containing protein [Selenomonas ruminantium]